MCHCNSSGVEEQELDQRNQQRSYNLASKVSQLRSIALDIENETHEHNRLLDSMGGDFNSGESLMTGSFGRVKNLLSSGRQNRRVMCYTAGFIVVFIVILYYLMTRIST
ncbi:BET1-like protein isoform X2 [Oratosquilla oratoria]|uniref:BET1-like protein isoform X2 n=1 Tax=Oratosquilla oratoria TaxID=337810 RepID=UPI003F768DCD